jgi:hypothetical protein
MLYLIGYILRNGRYSNLTNRGDELMIGGLRRPTLTICVYALIIVATSTVWGVRGLAWSAEAPPKMETVLRPDSDSSDLSLKEVPESEQRAMEGASDVAVKLARFYGEQENLKDQIFWLTIAVENGDDEQRLWLARALWRDQSDQLNIIRSRYWYKRIISSTSPEMSAFARKELDAKEKYRKDFPPNTPAN